MLFVARIAIEIGAVDLTTNEGLIAAVQHGGGTPAIRLPADRAARTRGDRLELPQTHPIARRTDGWWAHGRWQDRPRMIQNGARRSSTRSPATARVSQTAARRSSAERGSILAPRFSVRIPRSTRTRSSSATPRRRRLCRARGRVCRGRPSGSGAGADHAVAFERAA